MNPARFRRLLAKDLALGPRSPFFLFALVWPIAITLLIKLVFGELFAPTPRLGIAAPQGSVIAEAAAHYPGIAVTRVDDPERLWSMVAAEDVDAGWAIGAGFDRALASGERPRVEVKVAGGSLASHRILLAVAIADLLRDASPHHADVEVAVVGVGDGAALSIETRLLPMMVLFAVMLAGIFLPASGVVDEKSKGTLAALLVTPTTMGEFLLAKASFGFVLAMVCGMVTLLINGVLGEALLPLLVVLTVAAAMMAEIGLILGSLVNNTNTLFSVWKGGGWLLALPVIPYLWDSFPTWLARMSPTYAFVDPAWRVVVEDAGLADIAPTLGLGLILILVLVPVVVWAGRRAENRVGQAA